MDRSNELSMDQVFLQNLTKAVFDNLHNDQFGAEQLSKKVGLSRLQIHRKLQRFNGKSITQFIREIRLEEALRLLQKEVGTASEISYMVGFSSPSYFNKCFHDHYGFPPGEVSKRPEEKEPGLNAEPEKQGSGSRKNLLLGEGKIKKSGRRWVAVIIIIIICGLCLYFIGHKTLFSQNKEQIKIAVLPLWDLSSDHAADFLCKSIEEEIRFQLKDISQLTIVSGQSVEQYRNDPEIDYKLIGEKLHASYLVGGSFRKSDNYVRIEVQLINAKTGNIFWSNNYDDTYSGKIYDFLRNFASRIAGSLNATVESREKFKKDQKATDNQAALDLFWRANRYIRRYECYGDNHDLIMADKILNQIPKIDSDHYRYLGGKAQVCRLMGKFDSSMYYADRAIEIYGEEQGLGLKAILLGLYMNQPEKAISILQEGIEQSRVGRTSPWGYLALGQIYC